MWGEVGWHARVSLQHPFQRPPAVLRCARRLPGAAAAPQQTSEELYRAALAAADASEPTYCYCHRISFGEMIACEHPECPTEWFHFECVGLTADNRPKGKWYCKDCRKLLGKK